MRRDGLLNLMLFLRAVSIVGMHSRGFPESCLCGKSIIIPENKTKTKKMKKKRGISIREDFCNAFQVNTLNKRCDVILCENKTSFDSGGKGPTYMVTPSASQSKIPRGRDEIELFCNWISVRLLV